MTADAEKEFLWLIMDGSAFMEEWVWIVTCGVTVPAEAKFVMSLTLIV